MSPIPASVPLRKVFGFFTFVLLRIPDPKLLRRRSGIGAAHHTRFWVFNPDSVER
jgi:hypothetical protein